MKFKRPSPLVCYLLHFDKPVGRARHYLGSTFASHLQTRMRTHAIGRGAALTSAAVEGGSRLALAAVWPVSSREEEKRAKRRGHLNRLCPICQLKINEPDAQWLDGSFPDSAGWSSLGFPGSPVRGRGS